MKSKLVRFGLVLLFALQGVKDGRAEAAATALPAPQRMRCEYLENPCGIDVGKPRLSWALAAGAAPRGTRQAAYEILVASSAALLEQDHGDLWDSGKVASQQCVQIEYAGQPLLSRTQCFWKVRVWDQRGAVTRWSEAARWSMGLLQGTDWQASWISDAALADPANRPWIPIHCYRSQLANKPDAAKWITVDLGSAKPFNSIQLQPARPPGLNHDFRSFLYPVRFKVEAGTNPDFSDGRVVVDQTQQDVAGPRPDRYPVPVFNFPATTARYVRLTVTKLAHWDAQDYGFALAEFQIFDGKASMAVGAAVECSDSIETKEWSKGCLVDGSSRTPFGPVPAAIAVKLDVPHGPDMPRPDAKNGAPADATVSRVPLLRREFNLDADVRRATFYTTARGFYNVRINGRQVSDELLPPGFTGFDHRIEYQTHDVTALLHKGPNAIGALLGYGWYAGHMNLFQMRYIYGYFPQLLAQLEIDLVDGRRITIASDGQWKSTLSGPVRWSDLLDGEAYDCRREMPGWDAPGFDETAWTGTFSQRRDDVQIVAARCQPVRTDGLLLPVSVKQLRPGAYVFDMGQEMAGWCRVKVDGAAGTHITLRHAEAVKDDGSLDVQNLWGIGQQVDYFLDGKGPRTLEPHFTYQGFRYVKVTGLTRPPQADTLIGVHFHTDAPNAGQFECSNDQFNRLMKAARWTQDNMLMNVPAGCAARAERLAWLGDIRPCVQTAMFNRDTAAFFDKYLIDIRDSQKSYGGYCDITPTAQLRDTDIVVGAPGWADAGTSLPWDLYVNYADRRALEEHFESARRWVDFVHGNNPNLLWQNKRGEDWGDWLSAGQPQTPREVGATAFFAHSADLVARMALVLGRDAEARQYQQLFGDIKKAFNAKLVNGDGVIQGDAQGGYALALQFGLLDEPIKSKAIRHLLKAIAASNGHPTTGFWSSDALIEALSANGQHAQAAQMVNLRTMPSYGYFLEAGGTTLWEAWNAMIKGQAVNMSLNHWTHSAVGEWLWRNVAGINPDAQHPGYESFVICPRPTPEVSWCKATYESIRGPIGVSWKQDGGRFSLKLQVPMNSSAIVHIPAASAEAVQEGGMPAGQAVGVNFLRMEESAAVFEVQSGSYAFLSATAK